MNLHLIIVLSKKKKTKNNNNSKLDDEGRTRLSPGEFQPDKRGCYGVCSSQKVSCCSPLEVTICSEHRVPKLRTGLFCVEK